MKINVGDKVIVIDAGVALNEDVDIKIGDEVEVLVVDNQKTGKRGKPRKLYRVRAENGSEFSFFKHELAKPKQ